MEIPERPMKMAMLIRMQVVDVFQRPSIVATPPASTDAMVDVYMNSGG